MATENCRHGHAAPEDTLEALPRSQAGTGRHRCAVCAYAEGYAAGVEAGRRMVEEREMVREDD